MDKKIAADVRVESNDAHVRDLQSKYLLRFRAQKTGSSISMIIMHGTTKLSASLQPNFPFTTTIMDIVRFLCIPDGWLPWMRLSLASHHARIRCANIDYCLFGVAVNRFYLTNKQ